jgi:hypothetical protein
VAWDERIAQGRKLAVDDVEISAAYSAGTHLNKNLARARRRLRDFLNLQRLPGRP